MSERSEAKAAGRQTDPREQPERILIVIDGEQWLIRHICFIEHKLDFKRVVYHCDGDLGGPFGSIKDALTAAKQILHGARRNRNPGYATTDRLRRPSA